MGARGIRVEGDWFLSSIPILIVNIRFITTSTLCSISILYWCGSSTNGVSCQLCYCDTPYLLICFALCEAHSKERQRSTGEERQASNELVGYRPLRSMTYLVKP